MNSANKIPRPLAPELIEKSWSGREAWRVFEIIAEFAEATERLNGIRPAVSIFGSARSLPGHPYYALREQIARQPSNAGFRAIFDHYEKRGFEPSAAEREAHLNL
jgi:hypothetical protein